MEKLCTLEAEEVVTMEVVVVVIGLVAAEDLPTVMVHDVRLQHILLQVLMEMEVSRFHMLKIPPQLIPQSCQLIHRL